MSNSISKEHLNIWTDYILNYSLNGISKDDIVMVKGEKICWPLISVIQDKIFEAGAIADINIVPPDNDRGKVWGSSIARFGTTDQITKVPQWHIDRYNNMTKFIEILGTENPEFFQGQNDKLTQEVMKADEPIKNIRLAKPWVLTLFPTQAFAEMEDLSLEEYTKVIVNASIVNPQLLEDIEEDIYQLMDKSKTIRIVTEHPDTEKLLELSMSISNHHIIKCTGKRNFPDGEVYTSPDANSVEGEIFVDLPVFQGGSVIQGIYLKFENGKIIEYNAKVGQETLAKIIETDEGSHRLGEVALGMNNGIEKVLKHPLFVEKVGGTLHIAIGASYPNCYPTEEKSLDDYFNNGVMNKSAQHVDIVTDFRSGGVGRAVYLDDVKLEQKDNIWVVPKIS
ncbi:MAG: aminopeptidase [Ignavibacteriae bacterium]|nr:aminopeptidase [Ignavibacteriota bacterium]